MASQEYTSITYALISRRAAIGGALALALAAVAPASAFAEDFIETFERHDDSSTKTIDHSAWTELLKTYVQPGADGLNRVDYAAWKASGRAALTGYITALEAVDVPTLNRNEQFAFWANLYNAKTIDIVLDAYPVESIKKIRLGGSLFSAVAGGPWDGEVLNVGGHVLSLNNIEHDIMRELFENPFRAHYAVNCASVGCPNLGTEAFTGANLDTQLTAAAKAYINSPRGVTVAGGNVVASKIYSWFQEDFGDSEEGVLDHLRHYAEGDTAAQIATAKDIDDFAYDWGLNDVAR